MEVKIGIHLGASLFLAPKGMQMSCFSDWKIEVLPWMAKPIFPSESRRRRIENEKNKTSAFLHLFLDIQLSFITL